MDYVSLALIVGFVIWISWLVGRNFTSAGRARALYKHEKREAEALSIAEAKAAGHYRVSERQKSSVFAWTIILWGVVGGLFTSFMIIGLIIGAIWGVIIALASAAIARMAESKGRSYLAFFWLSALISPILMWIIAAAISPLTQNTMLTDATKKLDDSTESLNLMEQLQKLSELHEQGVLTKVEYNQKKKQLLERI